MTNNTAPKRAIVTGGSRGIGKAIVKELATRTQNGIHFADVVFTYNSNKEKADELEKELSSTGAKVFGFKADSSSLSEVQATIDFAIEKLGGVDLLINNAGITRDNLLMRMSEEEWNQVISANLNGVFYYSKAVLKPMMAQRYGRIVNISSVVGITGNAGQANYAASKAGVFGFTKSLAKEIASRNINVNAIAPGFIETDMTDKLNEKQKEALLSNIPMKRMGKPEDVARVAAFLCGEDADYITGQVITVDGGMVM
ncbi:MAG: 3-oxoacyl-[acyl-carrier-protein] reductase [Ignavibacteria bacterium GWB2_35_6b]|nr:MAG: 3-oxoacyl-[acyl-carrier-protein] reductase [Ignavibacteria bacterium GWB2_35_6b]